MKKRFVVGLAVGCILSFLISWGLGIESPVVTYFIGLLCGSAFATAAILYF